MLMLLLCWLVDTASLSKVVLSSGCCCCLCAGRAVTGRYWRLAASTLVHYTEQSKVLSHGHRILLPASAALLSVAQELEMSDDFSEKKSPTLLLGRASLNPPRICSKWGKWAEGLCDF